ncbi:MAG TPA: response regulator [Ktedonobacterales bacterium]|nr:response regulator [Ktedonobacterales bacterium]
MPSLVPQTASSFEPTYPETETRTHFAGEGEPTVMVIDDSMAVRTILEASFNRVGVRVNSYGDGITAIQALSRGDAPVPSVLLLDINLPRMDGYEVARILRGNKQCSETIILMLTGRDGLVDRVKSRLVGARAFIKKPFRVSDVVRTVGGYMHINLPGAVESPNSPPTTSRS